MFEHLTDRDVYCRFFSAVKSLTHEQLARYTEIDYANEMAFIAVAMDGESHGSTLGVVRAVTDPHSNVAEFAIVVRSDAHNRGLGHALMDKIIRYSRGRGLTALTGEVLVENRPMLALASDFGFKPVGTPSRGTTLIRLNLNGSPAPLAKTRP